MDDRQVFISDAAGENLDVWTITEDDVRQVIERVEGGATYFTSGDGDGKDRVILARYRFENASVYVQYHEEPDRYYIEELYLHRMSLNSDDREGYEPPESESGETAETRWTCSACAAPALAVDNIGLHYMDADVGAIDGLRCPSCGYEMIDQDTVVSRMMMSEMMLKAK